jgi:hypothetical protein
MAWLSRVDKNENGELEFKYDEGEPPPPDYLSYKEMMLVTQRWAPSTGWLSVLGVIGAGLCCMIPLIIWVLIRSAEYATP